MVNTISEFGINHIGDRINKELATFLSPLSPLFPDTVITATILNLLIQKGRSGENYKSYICNSHMEGMHGAVKLARHYNNDRKESPNVIFLEKDKYYENYFVPNGLHGCVLPGITFTSSEEVLQNAIKNKEAGIVVIAESIDVSKETKAFIKKTSSIVSIFDFSRVSTEQIRESIDEVSEGWDIVVWGEALTNFQIPIGAFSTRDTVYSPWNTFENCLLHSSTYAGNGMASSLAVKCLRQNFEALLEKLGIDKIEKEIRSSIAGKNQYSGKYMNSHLVKVQKSMNLDVDVFRARHNTLSLKGKYGKKIEVLDCVGGGGCNVLGHNPKELFEKIRSEYRPGESYLPKLEAKLTKITGLDKVFMGVSGASVVEIAMLLSRVVNSDKKKILVFSGNYAGKTLVALNGTYAVKSPFDPLYENVTFVNPFSAGTLKNLKEILEEGEVGLIWFEHIQGGQLLSIPPSLLTFLNRNKEKYGYHIGVDEILQGVYRTGDFLSFDQEILQPDFITLSKGLSAMIYPVATCIASKRVVVEIEKENPGYMDKLSELYRNEFSACLAAHVLEECENREISKTVKEAAEVIRKKALEIVTENKVFSRIEIRGFHLRFDLNTRVFPFKNFDISMRNKGLTKLFFKHGIFSFQGRILLPLSIREEELEIFIRKMEKIGKTNRLYFVFLLYSISVKTKLNNLLISNK